MKKTLFTIAIVFLTLSELTAQLGNINITSAPCSCPPAGTTGTITATPVPGATGYQWSLDSGNVNAVWFNGMLSPVQTTYPSVNISCQLFMQSITICVMAFNATDTSNTACASLVNILNNPVFDSTNSTTGTPGDSSLYALSQSGYCQDPIYVWTLTGAATFNNNTQTTTTNNYQVPVNVNFGPNFTTGELCVYAVSPFGFTSDTICMIINAPSGINDNTTPVVSFYHQPSLYQITLGFSATSNELISIKLYDIAGRVMAFRQARIGANQEPVLVSTSGLSNGMYWVEIRGAFFRKTVKFVKTY